MEITNVITLDEILSVDLETEGGAVFGTLHQIYSISKTGRTERETRILKWTPDGDIEVYQKEWDEFLGGKTPSFHNAAFDVAVLRELGIKVGPYHDSMIMGYNLNPNMRQMRVPGHDYGMYSIDAWGMRLGVNKLEHPPWDEWKNSPTFWEELPVYNQRDADIAWKVLEVVLPRLQKDERAWEYYMYVDLPFIEVIMDLNDTGMLVDLAKLEEWEQELIPVRDSLAVQMQELTKNCSPFKGRTAWYKRKVERTDGVYTGETRDKGSGVEHRFLFHADKFEPKRAHVIQAYKELYNVDIANVQEEYLVENFGDLPLTPIYLEYVKLSKLLSTYCKPFREKRGADGYVRASWKQMLITGRISSVNPSLQVLPSRDEMGATFRKFIVAPEGYKIVRVDFSNIEIRVMTALQAAYFMERHGHIPDDIQKIVDVFWNDPETPEGDFHGTMTRIWFGIDHTHPTFKHMRSNVAKHITFARVYGAGIRKLAAQMRVDYQTAKKRKQLADETNPSFAQFREWVIESFEEGGGYSCTWFGRRLNYPTFTLDLESDEQEILKNGEVVPPELKEWAYQRGCRQGFNALSGQGTAADILKMICVSIMYPVWALGARFCGLIHDELLLYVPDEHVEDAMKLLYIAVNREDILPYVPVRGTPSWGDNWLEAKSTSEKVYVHK